MAGLLDFARSPGGKALLANIGAGLLMAGFPQPYGRSRAQVAGPMILAGMRAYGEAPDKRQERRLRGLKIRSAEAELAKSESQRETLARLYGALTGGGGTGREALVRGAGYDPKDILPKTYGPETRVPAPPGAPSVTQRSLGTPPAITSATPGQASAPGAPVAGGIRGLLSDPKVSSLLFRAYPEIMAREYAQRYFGQPKAPTTRRRIAGGNVIQEEFDPRDRTFREIGRGPRFKPSGAPTLPQQANNAEIDAARGQFNALGLTREEILRRSQKATETGRDNPDYDPYIGRLVGTATQRKVGNDPDFESFYRRLYGAGGSAAPLAGQAQGAAGPPGVPPSLLPPSPAPAPRAALPVPRYPGMPRTTLAPTRQRRSATKPRVGERVTIQGKSYEVLKRNPDGTVMVMDLATGQQFIAE